MAKVAEENEVIKSKNRWKIKGGETHIVLVRMNNAAINQLMAERYLEEDENFYKSVESILTVISAINQNISTWQTSTKSVETYLKEKYYTLNRDFLIYHKKLLEIQEKAKKWC